MSAETVYTACVIVIGNEVLSGRTRDKNVQFLGTRLNEMGIRLLEARVIPDDAEVIVEAVNACRPRFDYVFTTGGIGPTHDDITAPCIARAFGRPLVRDPDAVALLELHYGREDLNEARLGMADVPEGSRLIDNPVSRAPGFQVENVFVLPGVPMIVEAMFDQLADRLAGGTPLQSCTVSAFTPEGAMAEALGAIQERHPEADLGSYPFVRNGQLGVSVVARGTDVAALEAALDEVRALMRDQGGDPVDGPRPSEG